MSLIRWFRERYYAHAYKKGPPEAVRMSAATARRLRQEFSEIAGPQLARRIRNGRPFYTMRLEIRPMQDDYIEFVWF